VRKKHAGQFLKLINSQIEYQQNWVTRAEKEIGKLKDAQNIVNCIVLGIGDETVKKEKRNVA
jgi:hypothetical protein